MGGASELFRQFLEFWKYASTQFGEPLLEVAYLWPQWRRSRFLTDEQLTTLARSLRPDDQLEFLRQVKEWADHEFPGSASAATWLLLHQLSGLDEFRSWETLATYRREQLTGLNAPMTLESPAIPDTPLVAPLRVVLLGDRVSGWGYRAHKLHFESPPSDNLRRSMSSLLGGVSFFCFLLVHGPCIWGVPLSPVRAACWGMLSALALTTLLRADAMPELILRVAPWVLFFSTLGLVWEAVHGGWREWQGARRKRKRLEGMTAVIVLGQHKPEESVRITEESYGVALQLATLLALFSDSPDPDGADRSALAWHLHQLEGRLPTSAFSGVIAPLSGAGPVGGIDDKVHACADAGIKKLFVPSQNVREARRSVRALGCATQIRNIRRWTPPLLSTSELLTKRSLFTGVAVSSFVILLSAAFVDSWTLIRNPASGISVVLEESIVPPRDKLSPRDEMRIVLAGVSGKDENVAALLSSRCWANRVETAWPGPSGRSYAQVPLDPVASAEADQYPGGEVEIVYRRSFLWRALPRLIVERVPLRRLGVSCPNQMPDEREH